MAPGFVASTGLPFYDGYAQMEIGTCLRNTSTRDSAPDFRKQRRHRLARRTVDKETKSMQLNPCEQFRISRFLCKLERCLRGLKGHIESP
jgi:hypothetical protein